MCKLSHFKSLNKQTVFFYCFVSFVFFVKMSLCLYTIRLEGTETPKYICWTFVDINIIWQHHPACSETEHANIAISILMQPRIWFWGSSMCRHTSVWWIRCITKSALHHWSFTPLIQRSSSWTQQQLIFLKSRKQTSHSSAFLDAKM